MEIIEVGWLSYNIVQKLLLEKIYINMPILLGDTNIKHMLNSHPHDYNKYKNNIGEIINNPDFGYINEKDKSIELIKEFEINREYVRVALRISNQNKLFVRTLFVVSETKMQNYIRNKKLVKL